jgi:hypothetical protein
MADEIIVTVTDETPINVTAGDTQVNVTSEADAQINATVADETPVEVTGDGDIKVELKSDSAFSPLASEVPVDVSKFSGNLSIADINVQLALETIDKMPAGSGVWGSITGTITDQTDLMTYFDGYVDRLPYEPSTIVSYYVSTTGSDITGDGSIGNPYQTIQHTVDQIPKHLGGNHIYVYLDDGVYSLTSAVHIEGFIGGALMFASKNTDYTKVTISANAGVSQCFQINRCDCQIRFANLSFTIDTNSGICILANNIRNLEFVGTTAYGEANPRNNTVGVQVQRVSLVTLRNLTDLANPVDTGVKSMFSNVITRYDASVCGTTNFNFSYQTIFSDNNGFVNTPASAPTTDYQVANKKYVDDEIIELQNWVNAQGFLTSETDPVFVAWYNSGYATLNELGISDLLNLTPKTVVPLSVIEGSVFYYSASGIKHLNVYDGAFLKVIPFTDEVLLLDQTSPQTISGGIPLLTGLTPTQDYEIATKKYVDDNAGSYVGGLDTHIQFNDGGIFGGDANFTWNKTDKHLRIICDVDNEASTAVYIEATGDENAMDCIIGYSKYGGVFCSNSGSLQAGQFLATGDNAVVPAVYIKQCRGGGGTGIYVDASTNEMTGSLKATGFITQITSDIETDGAIWYRTDLDELRFRLDGITYRANVSPIPA